MPKFNVSASQIFQSSTEFQGIDATQSARFLRELNENLSPSVEERDSFRINPHESEYGTIIASILLLLDLEPRIRDSNSANSNVFLREWNNDISRYSRWEQETETSLLEKYRVYRGFSTVYLFLSQTDFPKFPRVFATLGIRGAC